MARVDRFRAAMQGGAATTGTDDFVSRFSELRQKSREREQRRSQKNRINKKDDEERRFRAMQGVVQGAVRSGNLSPEETTSLYEALVNRNADKVKEIGLGAVNKNYKSTGEKVKDFPISLAKGTADFVDRTVIQPGDAITSQIAGIDTIDEKRQKNAKIRYEQMLDKIAEREKRGELSEREASLLRQGARGRLSGDISDIGARGAWAGIDPDNRLRIAIGAGLEAGASVAGGIGVGSLGKAIVGRGATKAASTAGRSFSPLASVRSPALRTAFSAGTQAGTVGVGEAMQGDEFSAQEAIDKGTLYAGMGIGLGGALGGVAGRFSKQADDVAGSVEQTGVVGHPRNKKTAQDVLKASREEFQQRFGQIAEATGVKQTKTSDQLMQQKAEPSWYRKGTKNIAKAIEMPGRAIQDKAGEGAAKLLQSNNKIARGIGRSIEGVLSGSTVSGQQMKLMRQKFGDEAYGGLVAENIQDTSVAVLTKGQGINKNNVSQLRESFSKIHSIMDPELFKRANKKTFKKSDLNPAEKQTLEFYREVSNFMNDLNYKNGFVDEKTWNKNKGGKYMPRGYDIDFSPEVKTYMKQNGMKLDETLYEGRKPLDEISDDVIDQMIEDPAFLLANRLRQTMANDARANLARSIAKDSSVASKTKKSGWVKLSDHSSHGDLKGMYLRPDMANMINGVNFQGQVSNALYEVISAYDRFAVRKLRKKILTIYSPATRLTNRLGNKFGFALMDGIDPVTHTKYMRDAKKMIDSNSPEYQEALKLGILGGDNVLPTLQKNAETIKRTLTKDGTLNKVKDGAKKIDDAATYSYSGVDDQAKLAAYLHHTRRGYSPAEAAERVARHYQNYRTVGWAWDVMSKSPILGNAFARFMGDFIRISINNAIDNPLRAAAIGGSFMMLQDAMSAASGESEEDRETREGRAFQQTVPFTNIPLTLQTQWGEVDISRVMGATHLALPEGEALFDNPVLDTLSAFGPVTSPVKRDSDTGELGPNVRALLGGEDVLSGPFVEQLLNENFKGEKITEQEGGRLNQFATSAGGTLSNTLRNINRARQGEDSVYGSDQDLLEAISGLTPFRVEQFGPEEAETQRELNQYFSGSRDLMGALNDIESERRVVSRKANDIAPNSKSKARSLIQAFNDRVDDEIDRIIEEHGEDNLDWRALAELRTQKMGTSDVVMSSRAGN